MQAVADCTSPMVCPTISMQHCHICPVLYTVIQSQASVAVTCRGSNSNSVNRHQIFALMEDMHLENGESEQMKRRTCTYNG